MPDSLCADEFVGELLNVAGTTAQEHYFKACIVIQMGMQRRNDNFVMFMLQIGQFFRQKASVVIIDQRNGPHYRSLRGHNRSPNKPVPDQIPECLRAVIVAFFRDEPVKPIEQIRLQRHSDSAELRHGCLG